MSITLAIYSNTYNVTKNVLVDFVGEIAAISDDVSVDNQTRYFFKFTTSAKDTSDLSYAPRIVENLTDLALNKTKQSVVNTANAYSDIKSMVTDYAYDYIHGHVFDKFSSGVQLKAPMKFSS